jgi:hypothetical protein
LAVFGPETEGLGALLETETMYLDRGQSNVNQWDHPQIQPLSQTAKRKQKEKKGK